MKSKKLLSIAAIFGVLTSFLSLDIAKAAKVKCKGVSTKYMNDCEANGHACGGYAKTNFDKNEWVKMSKKDCKTIQTALKNKAIKEYIVKVQSATVTATKRGKKF